MSSARLIWNFPLEMKGLGCSDTSVKYRMPMRIMDCRDCDRPNLFNCHIVHGYLSRKCQARSLALYELELKEKWEGKKNEN